MTNLQYLCDSNGKTTGVYVPIEEWIAIQEKFGDKDFLEIPENHKKILDERLKNFQPNPDKDFEKLLQEKRAKYNL